MKTLLPMRATYRKERKEKAQGIEKYHQKDRQREKNPTKVIRLVTKERGKRTKREKGGEKSRVRESVQGALLLLWPTLLLTLREEGFAT